MEALRIVQARAPELNVDGELQADAAVDRRWSGKSQGARIEGGGPRQHAGVSEPGIGQYRLQAGGAAGRRDGDRAVHAGAGQAGQRSFARLLGGGYLQCRGGDGAAIGDAARRHAAVTGWSITNATICISASTSFPSQEIPVAARPAAAHALRRGGGFRRARAGHRRRCPAGA